MIKSVLKIGLMLVAGILVYNYFFGSPEEKAQSKEIFSEVKDLGKAAWGLLKTEKDKFDDGKYDDALDKIGGLFNSLKRKAEDLEDSGIIDKLAELERRKDELAEKVADMPDNYDGVNSSSPENNQDQELKKDWNKLLKDTESLMKEMEGKK